MASHGSFLLLSAFAFLAAALAAPWPSSIPICAEECPLNDMAKFKYLTDKTYVYEYSGKSSIELKGVDGAVTETAWKKNVLLSWLSPCEMAITFEGVTVDGSPPIKGSGAEFLMKYPLVVAISDGRVQQVCSHPLDDPWAINMKKGVATAFQNVLPDLTSLSSGVNYTETDVVGRCPTRYDIENQGERVIVRKGKNHRLCNDRYPTPDGRPRAWLKTPLPVEESWSTCEQEINNGLYTSISCEDRNTIKPSVGAYKHIEGVQVSMLKYLSENSEAPESLSRIHGEYEYNSLLFDHRPLRKEPDVVPLLEEKLKAVCEKTKERFDHDSASMMAELIQLLKRVPDTAVPQTLTKIRGGEICPQKQKIEGLYLDAIAFTHESNSVQVIVDELLKEESPKRLGIYSSALYNTHYADFNVLDNVIRLFRSDKNLPSALLSAASLVNDFCRRVPNCQRIHQVKTILSELHARLNRQCIVCDDDVTKNAGFATLEALGNIGIMSPEISKATLKCIETRGVDTNIQVAAIRSFRNAECQRYATSNLVNIAMNHERDTEVRIASYLAAMRCAEKEDLNKILTKISVEHNTQVRSFVLSHMLNIQKSTNPEKANLKYLLNNFVIPTDYGKDFQRYSYNGDRTFYEPRLGLGGGVESNVIYGPGSFIPRSVVLNFTSLLFGQPINFGEVGARFEGLGEILAEFFGPHELLNENAIGTLLDRITEFVNGKASSVVKPIREKRSIDATSVSDMLKQIYQNGKSKLPKVEMFANVMGQDIAYEIIKGDPSNLHFAGLFDNYTKKLREIFAKLRNVNQDYSHLSQTTMDYHLSSIQGTPLRIRFDGTVVLGMKMEGKLDLLQFLSNPGNSDNSFKIIPSLSVQADGFVGYDCYLGKTGIQMNNTISSNSGMAFSMKTTQGREAEFDIDVPNTTELINIESETYLMKVVRGSKEHVVIPPSVHNVRITEKSCSTRLKDITGFEFCTDINVPDIIRSNGLPLGPRSFVKFNIQVVDPLLRGYKIKAGIQNNQGSKTVKLNVESKGTSAPRTSELIASYVKDGEIHHIKATAQGTGFNSGLWVNLKNKEHEMELETFAEYKSSEGTLSQGFKAQLNMANTTRSKSTDLLVFASQDRTFPPASQVFSMSLLSRNGYETDNVGIVVKTHNEMRKFLALTCITAFDFDKHSPTRFHMPKKLRNLEFFIEVPNLIQTTMYVRPESDADNIIIRTSAFKVKHYQEEIFSIEGKHTMQTSLRGKQFLIRNEISAKIGSSHYKVDHQLFHGVEKTGTAMKIIPQTGGTYYLDFDATISYAGHRHMAHFLVDIPAWIKPLQMQAEFKPEHEDNMYQLLLTFKHGEDQIFMVQGPSQMMMTPIEIKFEGDWQITVVGGEHFKFNPRIHYSHKELKLFFHVADTHRSLLKIEWKVGAVTLQETHIAFVVDIADLVTHRLEVIAKEHHIEIDTDNVILLGTRQERRVKADLDILYEDKKMKFDVSWDADRDPSRHFILESHLVMIPSQPGHYTLLSTVHYSGKPYQVKLDINAEYIVHPAYGQNGFKLILTDPDGKTIMIEQDNKVERVGRHARIDSLIVYKNLQDMEYKFTNLMDLEQLSSTMSNFKVNSEMRFKRPQGGESSFRSMVERIVDSTGKTFKSQLTAAVAGTHPVIMTFSTIQKKGHCSGEFTFDTPRPSKLLAWNVEFYPRGRGLKTFMFSNDFTGIANLLKYLRPLIVGGEATYPAVRELEESLRNVNCQCTYNNPEPHMHTLSIQVPDRRMEVISKVSSRGLNVVVYPNKELSEVKYEMDMVHSIFEKSWDSPDVHQWQGRITHPSFIRDKVVTIQVNSHGASGLQGTLEIDVLPDSADKLTAKIYSSSISKNTINIEASLSSRILDVNPKSTMQISIAPHTYALAFDFQRTPSSPVSFALATKYDRISDQSAVLSLDIENEQHSVISLSAIKKALMEPDCYGMEIQASTTTSIIGAYDVHAKLCEPMYVKMTVKKHGSSQETSVALGYQSPRKLEVSLSKHDLNTYVSHNSLLAQMKLSSPTMVNLDFDYEARELEAILNFLHGNVRKVVDSTYSWLQAIKSILQEAAKSKHIQFPSEDFLREWQIIEQESGAIYRDLRDNKIHYAYEKIMHFLRSSTVSYITDVYYSVWSKMADIHKKSSAALASMFIDISLEFRDIYSPFSMAIRELVVMMENGGEPEFVKTLVAKIEETSIYRYIKTLLDDLRTKDSMAYQTLEQVWLKVKVDLRKDLEKLRLRLMAEPVISQALLWVNRNLIMNLIAEGAAENVVARILQEIIYVTVTKEDSHLGIQIPIREPLQSLSQFVQEARPDPVYMLKNIIWSYDTYITLPVQSVIKILHLPGITQVGNYFPPFNASALLIGNDQVLTFDGSSFRIPKTECEIRLLTHSNATVSFKHIHGLEHAMVSVTYLGMKITVDKNSQVKFNGRKVSDHADLLGFAVDVRTHYVNISTPLLYVHVPKDTRLIEVRASGWLFGEIAGLLGTFDGERANDWLMPTGALATDTQQFVTSWNEDHNCRTPALEPVHVPTSREVECHTLVGMRSRCNPLIDPKPFIQMCREADSPCHPARAYRYLCMRRGLFEPYPMPQECDRGL